VWANEKRRNGETKWFDREETERVSSVYRTCLKKFLREERRGEEMRRN
jgi:hypothetical protein